MLSTNLDLWLVPLLMQLVGVTSVYLDMSSSVCSYRCSGEVSIDANMNADIKTEDAAEDGRSGFDDLIV